MRHQLHVAADAQRAEEDLQAAGQHHHGERRRKVAAELGDDERHHHRHRASGARDLVPCAAEERGEEADQNRAPQAGERARAGGDAESESQGQGDDGGGESAEQVALVLLDEGGHARAFLLHLHAGLRP